MTCQTCVSLQLHLWHEMRRDKDGLSFETSLPAAIQPREVSRPKDVAESLETIRDLQRKRIDHCTKQNNCTLTLSTVLGLAPKCLKCLPSPKANLGESQDLSPDQVPGCPISCPPLSPLLGATHRIQPLFLSGFLLNRMIPYPEKGSQKQKRHLKDSIISRTASTAALAVEPTLDNKGAVNWKVPTRHALTLCSIVHLGC
jgi:hypothetical protein